jgi:chromate transport protein ChrA
MSHSWYVSVAETRTRAKSFQHFTCSAYYAIIADSAVGAAIVSLLHPTTAEVVDATWIWNKDLIVSPSICVYAFGAVLAWFSVYIDITAVCSCVIFGTAHIACAPVTPRVAVATSLST